MKLNTQKFARLISLGSLCLFSGGCASIMNGGAKTISINSSPSGAKVTIAKEGSTVQVHQGATPMTVSLEPKKGYFSGQSYNVRVELKGYRTAELVIRPELSGWFFGNLIFGGPLGLLIIDPLTGSMWNLAPNKIEQSLSAEQATLIKNSEGFVVALFDQTTESERANMQRIN